MTALQAALPLLTELRQALGQHGELSGQEAETRRLLREFLARHTSLELYDLSGGLVAAHREPQGPCIAFRGDMDAIPGPNGPITAAATTATAPCWRAWVYYWKASGWAKAYCCCSNLPRRPAKGPPLWPRPFWPKSGCRPS